MKSVLYVGATLMIGASIYGFVDYKQTGSKKEFKTMYAEEESSVANNMVTEEKKVEAVKPVKEITLADIKAAKKAEVKKNSVKKGGSNKVTKKKRKFSTKYFSRGALDERYIEPVEAKAVVNTKKN